MDRFINEQIKNIVYGDLYSPVFKESLSSFAIMKNKKNVKDILEEKISSNENVLYAKLIMSPEIYETLGEDNIKKMSLKRIHHLTFSFIAEETKKLYTVPCHILVNEDLTMEKISTFLKIRDIISEKPELVSVLENETGLEQQSSTNNILFAQLIISYELREALGKYVIMNENMSPERMYTIEKRLTVSLINIFGRWLAHKNMTVDKIILISQGLSEDEILSIGVEKLAEMDVNKLQEILYN